MCQQGFCRGLLLLTAGIAIGFSFILGSDQKSKDPLLINKNGKWGYADATGKIVIEPKFSMGEPFENGFAAVWDHDSNYLINTKGKRATAPNAEVCAGFSEGLILAKVNGKYGYLNEAFKWAIEPRFDFALNFSQGLALVKINNKFGYIDRRGKLVIQPQFDYAQGFSDGLAAIGISKHPESVNSRFSREESCTIIPESCSYGYINRAGEMVIKANYKYMSGFSEGLAAVSTGTPSINVMSRVRGHSGYIDKTGKVAIELKYNDARDFSEGLAAVMVGNKYGYIDKKENIVIPPTFETASEFKNGLALVSIGETSYDFEHSVAHIIFHGVHGYINRTGEFASEKLCWRTQDAPIKP
jgi:hypothetical protein